MSVHACACVRIDCSVSLLKLIKFSLCDQRANKQTKKKCQRIFCSNNQSSGIPFYEPSNSGFYLTFSGNGNI